jgi:hypothetical protein
LRNRLTFGNAAQQTAHDFAAAGFGQVVAKADVFGFSDGANFFGYPVAQLGGYGFGFVAGGAAALQDNEGANGFAGEVIGAAYYGGFGYEVAAACYWALIATM